MKNKIVITNGAIPGGDSVQRYIKELKKYDVLTKAEELDLARRIRKGDQAALNALVTSNSKFVMQVARKYQGMGLSVPDLIGFGNIGMIKAAHQFDPERDVKFISFAVHRIRAEINAALNDYSRTVRYPAHKVKDDQFIVSTSARINDDEDSDSYENRFLEADDDITEFEVAEFKTELNEYLKQLKPKVQEAVCRYYGLGLEYPQSFDHIAEEMELTSERARQLVRTGEKELKQIAGIESLLQYI